MWSSKAELVDYYKVSVADVANLKTPGTDVTSVSSLVMQFTILLCLWLGLLYSGFFCQSRGEQELKLGQGG